MTSNILGTLKLCPDEKLALENYGELALKFMKDGELVTR
jgi:hypothetical protein